MNTSRLSGGLPREEYVEQAYFYRLLIERLQDGIPIQEVLYQAREESLATTQLPLAIDFLLSELRHCGVFANGMQRLAHYFTPFQTFVIAQAEEEGGRFDMLTALEVLQKEAEYRSKEPTPEGLFLYQFETLSRNRLNYDRGLSAMSDDPAFDKAWRTWILTVRRQVGIVSLGDLVYVRSAHYVERRRRAGYEDEDVQVLFGDREGKIAFANRRKDPRFLFSALQRHLGYPAVPRRRVIDQAAVLLPQILRRLERIEQRVKLLEEEQRGGIDLSRFMPGKGEG